ncbi:MAG: hypothetical protein DRN04_14875 [Thermoprotei archaeon]|nr:MAG: hypothetical protein DRN04_14875 [Thermoprotei archaeon]
MSQIVAFTDKLEILRSLDSIIDFAKSTIQLEILLYLGLKKGYASASEIAIDLGLKFKSVYDALTKLARKGLIEKKGGGYLITKDGREFVRNLCMLVSGNTSLRGNVEELRNLRVMVENFVTANYLYDIILALGCAKNHEASLDKLSKLIGISKARLKSYIELFVDNKSKSLRLFEKVIKYESKIPIIPFVKRKKKIYYRLTEQGLKELKRLYEYRRYNRNIYLKLLFRITFSLSKSEAYKKLIGLIATGIIASIILSVISGSLWIIGAWLCIVQALSALALISEYVG